MKNLAIIGIIISGIYSPHSLAQNEDTTNPSMEMSTSQREQMADAHENLAKCLRSNKNSELCMVEMRTKNMDMMAHCKMEHSQMKMSNPPRKVNK
jgi:hypothetical protein